MTGGKEWLNESTFQRVQADLAAIDHALTTQGRISGEVKIEYGQLLSSGGYQTFNDSAEVERIYPMADRIKAGQRFGARVYRRRIVVLEDWDEVPGRDAGNGGTP